MLPATFTPLPRRHALRYVIVSLICSVLTILGLILCLKSGRYQVITTVSFAVVSALALVGTIFSWIGVSRILHQQVASFIIRLTSPLGLLVNAGLIIVVLASWADARRPAVIGHDCGEVVQLFTGVDRSYVLAAESCLAQAYQYCHTATLHTVFQDADVNIYHYFTVQPLTLQSGCGLWDAEHDQINLGSNDLIFKCGGLQQQSNGLSILGCGAAGNLFLSLDGKLTPYTSD